MSDRVQQLASLIAPRLRAFGYTYPSQPTVYALLQAAYLASLRTEEARFVKVSVCYADPRNPDDLPGRIRANYPKFSPLRRAQTLTPAALTKLARAVDRWSGAIAVWGNSAGSLVIWGIVDQLVGTNVRLHREASGGFDYPGLFTVIVDGVADMSVYRGEVFLGGLRADNLIRRHSDAFHSLPLKKKIIPHLLPVANAIASALGEAERAPEVVRHYFELWANAVARLCIGLRRLGTGGALIITPSPLLAALTVGVPFNYRRLGEALPLQALDEGYYSQVHRKHMALFRSPTIPLELSVEMSFADEDLDDRLLEVSGATKLVTSLAAVDGTVLMTPELHVSGFGVKIGATQSPRTVYDGPGFMKRGAAAKKINTSQFGTRHNSVIRYCKMDRSAIGVVISQDGAVRMVMTVGRTLTFWDNVKLLGDSDFTKSVAAADRRFRRKVSEDREPQEFGYTKMPKTVASLLK